jgi:phospholipid-translocating ATPase
MSVIVQCQETKNIFLLCKGADSIIEGLLADRPENDVTELMKAVEGWAETGLRTLVLAKRDLSPTFYQEWYRGLVELLEECEDNEQELAS